MLIAVAAVISRNDQQRAVQIASMFKLGHKFADQAIDESHQLKLVVRHPAVSVSYPIGIRKVDKQDVGQARSN